MNLKINRISLDGNFLKPTLLIDLEIEYYSSYEIFTSITGYLGIENGKKICEVKEKSNSHNYNRNRQTLNFRNDVPDTFNNSKDRMSFQLIGSLDYESIHHIESIRLKNLDKSINFYLILDITKIYQTDKRRLDLVGAFNTAAISQEIENYHANYAIAQSDWVQKFSSPLGIGKYILVQLKTLEAEDLRERFQNSPYETIRVNLFEKYERIVKRLHHMEDKIKSGEWDLVLRYSREVFELLKLGDPQKRDPQVEADLKNLFKLRNGSEVGFDEFYKGILELFKYSSKFVHELDPSLQLHDKPNARSEDAYLAYSLCISLVNLIVAKI